MRKYWMVFLIAVLAAGCASASTYSLNPSANQEEQIQKLLVGTWKGYLKDNPWVRISYVDRTLVIYRIRKEQSSWMVNASLNRRSLEYINLYVDNGTITLKMMDRDGGFYVLTLYHDTHLLGHVAYEKRTIGPFSQEVMLKRVSY